MTLHRVLLRQLKKLSLDEGTTPNLEKWQALLQTISASYQGSEEDRYLIERALALNSEEMRERWETLKTSQAQMLVSAKMASLGEMAGGIAHEINTPLSVISIAADTLLEMHDEGELDPKFLRRSLDEIIVTVSRIAKIIQGLRYISRDGTNDPVQDTPLVDIVSSMLGVCQETCGSEGIQLHVQEIPSSIVVPCRPIQISQVLLNLMNNSRDAVAHLSEKWIRIEHEVAGSDVKIMVTDSGKGIPTEIQGRIMQPFFTTKEIGKGTGLGLSISKGIIDSHSGSFEYDQHSPNTRFIMKLPARIDRKQVA